VHADVWVEAHGQDAEDGVQFGVGAGKVVHLQRE
jgi:hypothetical protein